MNILGLANNYKGMPDDGKEPVIFWKGGRYVFNDYNIILVPNGFGLVWPEVELVIKMTNPFMFGVAMDITAASLDGRDVHLPPSKAIKSFCPVGDTWANTYSPDAELRLTVNGEVIQQDHIRNMRYRPEKALAHVQKYIFLYEDDLVITGTPPHPYYNLKHDDVLVASIEGIGSIERRVVRI